MYWFQYIVGGVFRVYILWPAFDIPMHFLGGFTIGMTGFFLIRLSQEKGWLDVKSKLVSLFIILCFVALFATLWELYEFLMDTFLHTHNQPSIADTMGDMFLGLLGGLCVSLFFVVTKPPPSHK